MKMKGAARGIHFLILISCDLVHRLILKLESFLTPALSLVFTESPTVSDYFTIKKFFWYKYIASP